MSVIINDSVVGALKLLGLPESNCYTTVNDLLKAIETLFAVEIPTDLGAVVVGQNTPTEEERDKVWFRRDVNGKFVGIYVFCNDKWILAYNIIPGELPYLYGDSRSVPDGFRLATSANGIPTLVANHIMTTWLRDPTSTFYVYFQVFYIGC